jgi:hypothetical protein
MKQRVGSETSNTWSTGGVFPEMEVSVTLTEGLASLERAIPWTELAEVPSQGPRASSSWAHIEKLSQSSILLEDWAIHRMAWYGQLFERGFWDGNEDQVNLWR